MADLHKLEEYTIETVESFITNEIEESIHVEFKAADALGKSDHHKKEISKDVSAFANSDGGIIIYGIAEQDHKASSLSFIDGNEFTSEWLEQVISSSIQRNIQHLKIFPIRKNGNIAQSLYVVQIPCSFDAPHMYKDKKFYRRYNFSSVAMEEYEVRQLYDRKTKSVLAIDSYSINHLVSSLEFVEFDCIASIQNIGETIEDNYKLNVYLKNFPDNTGVYWKADPSYRNLSCTHLESERFKVSASSLYPIYPDETLDVIRFTIKIKSELFQDAVEKAIIEFALLYPNGREQHEAFLRDFVKTPESKTLLG